MSLHESGEDYLETIYLLSKKNPFVRSVDIANELNYTKASVSRAMKLLREANLITMAEDGQIRLTKNGLHKAQDVYSRHTLITDFFEQQLGVNAVTAEKDACKIEHVISEETFLRLRAYMVERGYEPRL
ncbi:MAG: metal-dependent transcriptional regulator [Oscillospiraceae bacterium]|nr:metal-dependent transcriptional regulator [Oscillospiraceae bacterium]MDE5884153.1 metal-dependent transcriptional regulator [Oscillospiraceae bacterium]